METGQARNEDKSEDKKYGEYRQHYSEPDFWRKVGNVPRDARTRAATAAGRNEVETNQRQGKENQET